MTEYYLDKENKIAYYSKTKIENQDNLTYLGSSDLDPKSMAVSLLIRNETGLSLREWNIGK